jgi:hypothetical protein
MYSHLNLIIN